MGTYFSCAWNTDASQFFVLTLLTFFLQSPRGDGFPLANMLALVAVDHKDIVPVLAAHIYSVCPTAIPTLPNPSPNASEEELMESLGMLRKEDGTFETFERFLQRTEVRATFCPPADPTQQLNLLLYSLLFRLLRIS